MRAEPRPMRVLHSEARWGEVEGGGDVLASTELLVGNALAWVRAGQLPSTLWGLRGINMNNMILMTGNRFTHFWSSRNSFLIG